MTIGAGAVHNQERLGDGGKLPRETPDRRWTRRPKTGLVRQDTAAELHEKHGGPAHIWHALNAFLKTKTETSMA
jgi:hypothetical protein